MIYTILAYKPSNEDYRNGCFMSSFSSLFEYKHTENREEALRFLIDKFNRSSQGREADFDFTIFVDGKLSDQANYLNGSADYDLIAAVDEVTGDDQGRILLQEALNIAREEKTNTKEMERINQEKRKALEAERKEAQELAEYLRLQKKFSERT